ncbi:MAG: methyltransferase domain-containing protein [Patescibacteria group bacterium]|nr:methyltransferase domain-containing protein [Patescibacteria group bacterium]
MNNEISDYDKYGYDYEAYWENPKVNRSYENQAEKSVIKKLLKKVKNRNWFCDLGAGFGRLFDTYGDDFFNIILVDYSVENLKKAQEKINEANKLTNLPAGEAGLQANTYFVAANAYHLPFKPEVLDCLLSVRMMHHMEDPTATVGEISRVIRPEGKLILEYANKRHFFEVIRALFKKSKMSPFSLEPTKRGDDLFYNFHPKYIKKLIQDSGLKIIQSVSVSNFRHKVFKKVLGTKIMLFIDKIFRPIFSLIKFGPSIFVLAEKKTAEKDDISISQYLNISDVLLCPKCGSDDLMILKPEIRCKKCERTYPIIDGVYDFRIE